MDRLRAGLTGLGLVFLSTLAASLVFGPSEDDPAAFEHVKAPGEPLAQLGVAPGVEKDKSGEPVIEQPGAGAPPPADLLPADPLLVEPVRPPDVDAAPGAAAGRPMGADQSSLPPSARRPAAV